MLPILFHIGPLPVHSWGVMLMLGFLAGVLWIRREAPRQGLPADSVVDLCLGVLIAGVIGARVLFILLQHSYYTSPAQWFQVWQGGLSWHGGLVAGAATLVYGCVRRHLRALDVADLVAPGVALGYGIARLGCLLNGCCYGIPCNLPWAIRFPDPSAPGGLTPPSHPTQLYAFFTGLLMFAFLARLLRHRRYPGQVTAAYLILYAIYRFLIEILRKGVTAQVMAYGLTQAQVASIGMLILGVVLQQVWARRARRLPAPAPAPARETAAHP